MWEQLELRTLFSAAFDVTDLTALRADNTYNGIDGSDMSVAVLDTGLYAAHPDISGNFIRFFDAVTNGQNALTDPGTATINQAFDPPGEGHGTHVAGTVGSTNANIGVATGTNLIGVRVLTSDGDPQPQVNPLVAGLQWVLANQSAFNIRVVNMSLGNNTNYNSVPNKDDVARIIDQLEARGVTVVAASGNSYGGFASLGTAYPSIFSTIAVANTWEDSGTPSERNQVTLGQGNGGLFGVTDEDPEADQLSASSQRSTVANQVAAPGTTIFSTWNGDGGLMYNTIAGTSMASPFVAGSVALMQDAAFTFGGRYLTPDEVLAIVKETADNIVDADDPGTARFPVGEDEDGNLIQIGPIQDLPESGLTYKRINVYSAVQRVRELVTGGSTPNPGPGTPTNGDTNSTLAAATAIPNLNGLDSFDFTGNIGADGSVDVGPGDVDMYRINLDSPGYPVFTMNNPAGGQAFNPYLRLFDSTGNQLAFEDDTSGDSYPTLNTQTKLGDPLAAGVYYLGISSVANTSYVPVNASGIVNGGSEGDYVVTIGLSNPDPNGVVQGAFSIDLTNPDVVQGSTTPANFVAGTIDTDPNPATADGEPRIQIGAEDVDFFSVIAPDTGRLTINIDARSIGLSSLDSYVVVYAEDNLSTPLGTNDDENFGAGLLDSLLTVNVVQGARYFIAITTFQNSDFSVTNPFDRESADPNAIGGYQAYVSFSNGDTNGAVVNAVEFSTADGNGDGQALGNIGADLGVPLISAGTNGGNKDVDFFSVMPTQPGLLEINAIGDNGFDAVLGLWTLDDQSRLVAIGDTNNAPASIGLEITQAMLNHALFVSVTGAGNQGFNPFAPGSGNGGETGDYTLSVIQRSQQDYLNKTNNSISSNTPDPINVGEPLRRDVGRDGVIDVGADDIDMYRFDSPYTGTLTVRTDTSDEDSADTFLRVFDAQGNEIAFNNNASSSTTASTITLSVTAGQTYFIGVNGASDNARDYDALTGEGAAAGSEGHYTIVLEASNSNLPLLSVSNVTVTEVLGEKTKATVTLTLNQPFVSSNGSSASVLVATANDTATDGLDYVGVNTLVPFTNGSTTATIDIDIFGDFDAESSETFFVNLSGADGVLLTDNQAIVTILNTTPPEPTTFAGKLPLTFTGPGGEPLSLTIKGQGTGRAFFSPGSTSPGLIVLDNTSSATTLTFKGSGALPDIRVNGSLKSAGSKTTDLTGDLTVTGNAPKLTFGDITNATITIGGSAAVTMVADRVQGLILNSTAAIKSLKVTEWIDTADVNDIITTPALLALAAKGNMDGVTIRAGTIGKVTTGGAYSGEIRSEQSIASIVVGTTLAARVFAGVSAALDTLPDSADDFTNTTSKIGSVKVSGKNVPAGFRSVLAAPILGKISLGSIGSDTPFNIAPGVAANSIQTFSGNVSGQALKLSKLDDPAGSQTVGTFVLRLL